MYRIVFRIESGEDVTIFAADGENLLALARKANIAIDAPCSGNGSCGKCRVRLLEGNVGGVQSRHLSDEERSSGWVLACDSTVSGDASLLVPDIASAYKSRMKVADLSSPAETAIFLSLRQSLAEIGLTLDSGIRAVSIRLTEPSLDDTMPDNERLIRAAASALGASAVSLPFKVLSGMPDILRGSEFHLRCVAAERHGARAGGDIFFSGSAAGGSSPGIAEILGILPGDDTSPVCGLAIDVGTTTISGLLVDLGSGDILAKANAGNGQIRYGADVINRIIEQQKPGGVRRLQLAVTEETLEPLIDGLCSAANVSRGSIYRMAVASNTTMNHLLLGINANFLRTEPYIPAFFEIEPLDPSHVGFSLAPTSELFFAPNIGSYVGGDITAGTLACAMWDRPEMSLLIDLGTNGEIVFGNSDFLMACACSAGPAFEGGDIGCGMRATDGAIEACVIDGDSLEPESTVIGGGKPVGLCGSGLIDVVAELFRTSTINGRGKFIREGRRILRDKYGTGSYVLAFAGDSVTARDIALSETDIDNFIRAKAAIFSAIMSMITPLGFSADDIDEVMVAGGIGSGINIRNAIGIGMLPDLPVSKYRYIGNSSLCGAYAMLVSGSARERLGEIARNMTYLELSAQPGYMDEFIAACFLPHTDETLFPSVK